jgi:hypothetical protein
MAKYQPGDYVSARSSHRARVDCSRVDAVTLGRGEGVQKLREAAHQRHRGPKTVRTRPLWARPPHSTASRTALTFLRIS